MRYLLIYGNHMKKERWDHLALHSDGNFNLQSQQQWLQRGLCQRFQQLTKTWIGCPSPVKNMLHNCRNLFAYLSGLFEEKYLQQTMVFPMKYRGFFERTHGMLICLLQEITKQKGAPCLPCLYMFEWDLEPGCSEEQEWSDGLRAWDLLYCRVFQLGFLEILD